MRKIKKQSKLERRHLHELALMSGAMALLVFVALTFSSSVPRKALAAFIFVNSYAATPNPVQAGVTFNTSYTATNADDCSQFGSYDGGAHSFWNKYSTGNSGTFPVTGGITQTATFGIMCNNYGAASAQSTPWTYITVTATPGAVTTGMSANTPVYTGQRATISFFADSVTPPTGCQIIDGSAAVVWPTPSSPEVPCATASSRTYLTPIFSTPGTYTYNLYYDQGGWTYARSLTLTVTAPPPPTMPQCTLSASSNTVNAGDTVTLTYTDTGATSGSIDHGVGAIPPVVTGPIVTTYTGGSGSFAVPSQVSSVQVLVVAGGGGGGGGFNSGGGGGAGGVVYNGAYAVTPSGSVSYTVGAGGAGTAANTRGSNGNNSSFGSISAVGGGGGGAIGGAGSGGSGGGAGRGGTGGAGTGIGGQGSNGGTGAGTNTSSGGGGAGGAGGGGTTVGGDGGSGVAYSISGSSVVYGGGGGGGTVLGGGGAGGAGGGGYGGAAGGGGAGAAPSGGGGGGGNGGGSGGSGVVIVSYTYSNLSTSGTRTSGPINSATTYTMTVTNSGSGLSSTCTTQVNLIPPPAPVAAISATPATVLTNGTSSLVWSIASADPGSATLTAPSYSSAVTNFGSIVGNVGTNYYSSYIVAGGYTYELGGYDGVSAWVSTLWRIPDSVDISTTGGWTTLGSVTAGGSNVVGASISWPLVLNNTVYLFGGYISGVGYTYNICSIPVANLGNISGWSCPSTIPGGSAAAQSFAPPLIIGDYIYRLGGYNSSVGPIASVARAPISSPTSWTNYPNVLPGAVYSVAQAIVGNYVYIFGGNNSGTNSATIYRALISSDLTSPSSWTASPGGSLPAAMGANQVAVDANYVYILGGYTGSVYLSSIYKIPIATLSAGNVAAGSWTSAGTLPVAEANIPEVLYIGDKLYITGGYGPSGGGGGYINKIYGLTFNAGLPYTTPSIIPWHTDGSRNTATTWPLTVNSVTYTLQGTNVTGSNSASATVSKPDMCTNAPFSGIQNPLPSGVTAVGTTCTCSAAGTSWDGSACSLASPVTVSVFTGPSRVRKGNAATLSYTINNPSGTCTITGTNGYDSGSFAATASGFKTTNAITANTRFTLTCGTAAKTATVGIIPVFQEQ